jgi:hypothetical protein
LAAALGGLGRVVAAGIPWNSAPLACSTGVKKAICTPSAAPAGSGPVAAGPANLDRQNASEGTGRKCEVCGTPLASGVRSSARTCSSRCRAIKSRARRLHDLLQRLRRAEDGLREAADGLADYRHRLEHSAGKVAP